MLSACTLVPILDGETMYIYRHKNWRTLVKKGFTCITASVDHCDILLVIHCLVIIRCVADGISDFVPILQVFGDQSIHLVRHVSDGMGKF